MINRGIHTLIVIYDGDGNTLFSHIEITGQNYHTRNWNTTAIIINDNYFTFIEIIPYRRTQKGL